MKIVSQNKNLILLLITGLYIILCKYFEEVAYTLWITVGMSLVFCFLYIVEKPDIRRLLVELVGENDYVEEAEVINRLEKDLHFSGRLSMIIVSLLKYILMLTLCIPLIFAIALMGLGLASLSLDSYMFYFTLLGGIPLVYWLYKYGKSKSKIVLFLTIVAMGSCSYILAQYNDNYEVKLSSMILFFEIGTIVFYENFRNIFPRKITDNMVIKFSLLVRLYPYEILNHHNNSSKCVIWHPRSQTKNTNQSRSAKKTENISFGFIDLFVGDYKEHSDFFYDQMRVMGYDEKTNKYWPRLFYNELVRKKIARSKATGLCVKDAGRAFQEKFNWVNISTFEENRKTSSYTDEQAVISSDIDTIVRQLK